MKTKYCVIEIRDDYPEDAFGPFKTEKEAEEFAFKKNRKSADETWFAVREIYRAKKKSK